MKTIQNNSALQKRLLGYTAMASLVAAAGVGAGAQQAAAQPTVVDTPNVTIGAGETFNIDFDQNSTPEFTVFVSSSTSTSDGVTYTYGAIGLRSFGQSASVLGSSGSPYVYPYALNLGDPVSATPANGSWIAPTGIATMTYSGEIGNWINLPTGERRYLGVRYVYDNAGTPETRYGWVELTVQDLVPGPQQVTIHRYGHNTTAGEAIPAAVQLTDVQASSSPLRAAGAAVLTAVAGALTWLGLRVGRQKPSES
jgi:hypothetical protein